MAYFGGTEVAHSVYEGELDRIFEIRLFVSRSRFLFLLLGGVGGVLFAVLEGIGGLGGLAVLL